MKEFLKVELIGMSFFKKKGAAVLQLLCGLMASSILSSEESSHAAFGNFSIATSQQISPLVSFGQNIIDKGQLQIFLFGDAFIGVNSYLTDVIPYVVYGVRDDLSIACVIPFSPGNKYEDSHSSGIEDIYPQIEYSIYTMVGPYFEDQSTLLAALILPTGSSSKSPSTGAGSSSFFLGSTFSRTTYNWYFFTSPGVVLTTSKKGTRFGDQILYQCGIARNIPSPVGWIFASMLELDGQYIWKNKINGIINSNSGGNIIYLTPSLWLSSKKIIIQFGVGYPIIQSLFGNQLKQQFSLDIDLGVTF